MGLTGKYDFLGIKKAGAAAIKAALASTSWGASFVASIWFKLLAPAEDMVLEMVVNWMANNGLVILNLGANWANGEFDQAAFDRSIEEGLGKIKLGRDKLTPEQGKAIDDSVIRAADKFIDFGAQP